MWFTVLIWFYHVALNWACIRLNWHLQQLVVKFLPKKMIKKLRQWLPTFKGGQMFYLGCHIIDLAFRILGQPAQVLPLNFATCVDGIDGEDFCMAVLRYPKAVATVRTDGFQHGGYLRREFVVTGSKKTVELRPIEMRCPGGQIATLTEYDAGDWFEPGKTHSTER